MVTLSGQRYHINSFFYFCQWVFRDLLAQSGKVPFHQSYNVPFPQSYNVPFGKGTESGSTTKHEWQRIKQVGSNATAEREAVEAEGSGGDAGGRRAADQTATAQLLAGQPCEHIAQSALESCHAKNSSFANMIFCL